MTGTCKNEFSAALIEFKETMLISLKIEAEVVLIFLSSFN